MTASNSRSSVDGVSGGILGSARASRARCGASPQWTWLSVNPSVITLPKKRKFALARAPAPAREARALPRSWLGCAANF